MIIKITNSPTNKKAIKKFIAQIKPIMKEQEQTYPHSKPKYNFTVQELRQSGYKVRVLHNISEKTTLVQITAPTGHNVDAIAKCGHNDQFNKKRGVKIALNRAMKQLLKSFALRLSDIFPLKNLNDIHERCYNNFVNDLTKNYIKSS